MQSHSRDFTQIQMKASLSSQSQYLFAATRTSGKSMDVAIILFRRGVLGCTNPQSIVAYNKLSLLKCPLPLSSNRVLPHHENLWHWVITVNALSNAGSIRHLHQSSQQASKNLQFHELLKSHNLLAHYSTTELSTETNKKANFLWNHINRPAKVLNR